MNQKTFEELVKDSGHLNKDTLSELEQVLKEYPFCQTFHLLYTKNLYLEKHIRYHQQLKVAAAIVGDRSRLKHYLEDSDETLNSTLEPSVKSPVSLVEQEADYESMVLSTLDAKISREEKKKAIIALINKKFSERIDRVGDKKVEIATIASETDNNQETKVEIASGLINVPVENQVISIDTNKEIMPYILSTVKSSVPSIVISNLQIHEESASEKEEFNPLKEPLPTSFDEVETSSEELIEKFLRDAPRISRPKKEFYNPVNLAARSLEENEDFYTETYASICLRQGNVAKALKIYAKLSLKIPEKSSYFAGLIEKIEKEQNI